MTKNRNFKRAVRERMAATGERYSTARAHVLAKARAAAGTEPPLAGSARGGLFPAVRSVGGQQPDLASARNLCTNGGVVGPDGEPLSEAMAFGLAGGIGFLYGAFEYAEGPTMTIVARNESMPDPFCEPLFARAGVEADIATTGGAKKAATTLDAALAEQRPSLCTVGSGALSYLGGDESMAAMAPHIVGVVGVIDGGDLLIDDRSPEPIVVPREEFDQARAAYRQAKHRLITVGSIDRTHDWEEVLGQVVAANAVAFDEPPVPQFAANVGMAGLEKLARLLLDRSDKKGWSTVFGSGHHAAIGLSRLYDCVTHAYTAPAAGRPLYADFLDEAGAALGGDRFAAAAGHLRASGDAWTQAATVAAEADPAVARFAAAAEERAIQLDDVPDPGVMATLAAEQATIIEGCTISAARAAEAYDTIGGLLHEIVGHERAALEAVRDGTGDR